MVKAPGILVFMASGNRLSGNRNRSLRQLLHQAPRQELAQAVILQLGL
jgi:hypothetical protein